MPKVLKANIKSKKGNLFLTIGEWFWQLDFFTKSLIIFALAIIIAVPTIANINSHFQQSSNAYGWLGRCGGNGQYVCTTHPVIDAHDNVTYHDWVPGNQCAINATNSNLGRGTYINCCSQRTGSIYGTCSGNGSAYCSTSINICGPLVTNGSFETLIGSGHVCPRVDTSQSPEIGWTLFPQSRTGNNSLAIACANIDTGNPVDSNAVDGFNSMELQVGYYGGNPGIYAAQKVSLYQDIPRLTPFHNYILTFSAKENSVVSGDNQPGIVQVSLYYGDTQRDIVPTQFFYPGPNWQTFRTNVFSTSSYSFLPARINFNFGAKSQRVWIDAISLQDITSGPNIYTSHVPQTQCGINATKAGYPRGTKVYCACGGANGASPCQ